MSSSQPSNKLDRFIGRPLDGKQTRLVGSLGSFRFPAARLLTRQASGTCPLAGVGFGFQTGPFLGEMSRVSRVSMDADASFVARQTAPNGQDPRKPALCAMAMALNGRPAARTQQCTIAWELRREGFYDKESITAACHARAALASAEMLCKGRVCATDSCTKQLSLAWLCSLLFALSFSRNGKGKLRLSSFSFRTKLVIFFLSFSLAFVGFTSSNLTRQPLGN